MHPIGLCVHGTSLCCFCSKANYGTKSQVSSNNLHQLYLEHAENYHRYDNHLYTDGSSTDVGVGCSVVGTGQRVSSRLPACATIFTAELTAIRNVLRLIDNNDRIRFTIFSDSKSALQAIRKYNNNHPLVIEILTWLIRLHSRHKSVTFCWVPAHVGVAGNEKADTLAKRAITEGIIQGGATLYYKDYDSTFKRVIKRKWASIWDNVPNDNKLKMIKSDAKTWMSSYQKFRRNEMLCRLRIGHSRLTHGHLMEGTHVR